MFLKDPTALERIRQAARAAEDATSARLVVAVAPQSGSYLDRESLLGLAVALALAAVLAALGLGAVRVASYAFIAFGVAAIIFNRLPVARSLVVGPRRRARNVAASARFAFEDEEVDAAPRGAGLLLYASVYERAIRVLPSDDVAAKLGPGPLEGIIAGFGRPAPDRFLDALLEAIARAGGELSAAFPPD